MAISDANDAMILRLEKELQERNSAAQGLIANANEGERDLNEAERETLSGIQTRMSQLQEQIDVLESSSKAAGETAERLKQIDLAITQTRRAGTTEVEYRSAGEWALDSYKAHLGDRQAQERLEVYYRAAAHQTTGDNAGVVPDPIVGGVVNFIDAARPMVQAVGAQPLPSASWHRPKVTQHTSVDVQGSAGAAADEKAELVSQKMTISRLTAEAVTYGGYVNVSRQNIDFSAPQVMQIIINDLASQYAIQTEAALGTELDASTATAVGYGASPTAATVRGAVWAAVADIYAVTKGQGRLVLAVAPDRLEVFGPLFPPIFGVTEEGEGLRAGNFASGDVGGISGIRTVMSAGLGTGKAFLFSTAAVEVFEQRVGTLQVTEPSVLGVQVAYAGYFTPLTIDDGGIIELTAS